jgi:O-antigen ligase
MRPEAGQRGIFLASLFPALNGMASPLTVNTTIRPPHSAIVEGLAPQPPSYVLVWTLLIATLLAAPLAFGAVQEWAWGGLAVVAFLLLLFWSIAGARQGRLRIFWSPLLIPAGLFFLLGTIQFAGHLTMDPIATRESLLKLATDLILFFIAGQLFSAPALACSPLASGWTSGASPRRAGEGSGDLPARFLRWTVIAYTFLLALFAIFQFFSSQGLIYWTVKTAGWTFGPYVNHNHYAGLMEMLIPLMVASLLPALRQGASAVLLGFIGLIPIVSLVLAGSRGGFISLVAEVLLAAVLVFLCGPRHARKVTALLGGAAILAAALLFFWMAPRQIVDRLATMGDGTHSPEVELGNRLAVSRDSLRILRDHPWMGTGLGSFETVFPKYQSLPSDLIWDHAHNDYAEALAETGVAGGALILFAMGLFFRLAFRNLRQRLRQREGWLPIGAAIGCCGLLVHSFVDFNFHIPANAAWFAVCAAISRAISSGTRAGAGLPFGVGGVPRSLPASCDRKTATVTACEPSRSRPVEPLCWPSAPLSTRNTSGRARKSDISVRRRN